jgi:hypothetical protein
LARSGVRGTFSQPGPSHPAASGRLTRTLGHTKCTAPHLCRRSRSSVTSNATTDQSSSSISFHAPASHLAHLYPKLDANDCEKFFMLAEPFEWEKPVKKLWIAVTTLTIGPFAIAQQLPHIKASCILWDRLAVKPYNPKDNPPIALSVEIKPKAGSNVIEMTTQPFWFYINQDAVNGFIRIDSLMLAKCSAVLDDGYFFLTARPEVLKWETEFRVGEPASYPSSQVARASWPAVPTQKVLEWWVFPIHLHKATYQLRISAEICPGILPQLGPQPTSCSPVK